MKKYENTDFLIKFLHIYKNYIKQGKNRNLYTERLKIEFPKINNEILEKIDCFINKKEHLNTKLKCLYRDWINERSNFKIMGENQYFEFLQQRIDKSIKERNKMETNIEILRIKQELMEQREIFVKVYEEKLKDLKEKEEKAKSEEIKKQEKFKNHAKEIKPDAENYKIKKIEDKKSALMLLKEKEEKLKKDKEMQILINKPKVEIRQKNEKEKIIEKLELKEEKIKLQEENRERIEKLIECYKIRPIVERDENRLIQKTESLVAKQTNKLDKADKVELFKNYGFNITNLMSDMRYKLSTALFEAGIDRSQYALQVLNYMNKQE